MKRLARHLFTLCSAASLALCAAVCVLWARSYTRADEFMRLRHVTNPDLSVDGWARGLQARRGGLGVQASHVRYTPAYLKEFGFDPDGFYNWPLRHFTSDSPPQNYLEYGARQGEYDEWKWGGFQVARYYPGGESHYVSGFSLVAPCWAVAGLTVSPPLVWTGGRIRDHRRLRRARLGRCPECGAAATAAANAEPPAARPG